MRQWAMVVMAAAMATGCSSGGGGNNSSAASSAGGAMEQVPENLTIDPQNSVVPITPPSPRSLAAIPAAFRGRWGQVDNDCQPGGADAKGLMTVSATTLGLYQARATAGRIAQTGPDQLTLHLNYTGEGRHWQHDATLTMQDDGRTLIRDEAGDASGVSRYQRCPG